MRKHRNRSEKGTGLIEVLVSLALLGIIATGFLSGTATTSSARVTADGHASGKILAESVMDSIKKQEFDSSYNVTVPEDFPGYSANLTVTSFRNNSIQKITIDINYKGETVFTLEDYKVQR